MPVAQVTQNAWHLILLLREALEVMAGDLAVEVAAGLVDNLKPVFGGGDHDAGRGVHMDHAVEIGAGFENAAVKVVARGRKLDALMAEHAPCKVDGDKVRGRDLVPAEPV